MWKTARTVFDLACIACMLSAVVLGMLLSVRQGFVLIPLGLLCIFCSTWCNNVRMHNVCVARNWAEYNSHRKELFDHFLDQCCVGAVLIWLGWAVTTKVIATPLPPFYCSTGLLLLGVLFPAMAIVQLLALSKELDNILAQEKGA